MSIRGVRQLKSLLVRYSDYDGSSRGVRDWIRQDLIKLAQQNPELSIKAEVKRCAHPYLRGYYVNGNDKTISVRNCNPEDITDYFFDLRNQVGKKVLPRKNTVTSKNPSIQGIWHERMDLVSLDMKVEHKYE
mmetsp:Transcript_32005/g.69771  ORF Transcript_32005/g.69771 Transcript_32005/m.69771 type:complete len:132 (-) Transcript_32005:29-424(-)